MDDYKDISLVGKEMPCSFSGCKHKALSLAKYCWEHIEDKDRFKKAVQNEIDSGKPLKRFYLRRADFKGAKWLKIDLEGSDLAGCNFSGADLSASNLKNSDLTGADLSHSDLAGSDFMNAHLPKANLSYSRLWHTNFFSANLVEVDFQGADLLHANLANTKIWHTNFKNVKFLRRHSFSHKKGIFLTEKIDESGFLASAEAYRNLKQYFIENGRYDDASWASFNEKRMERLLLLKNKSLAYIPSSLMGILCGYGEKPYRVILSSISIIAGYAFIYYFLDSIKYALDASYAMNIFNYVYYSTITFATVGYGDFVPKLNSLYQLISCSEGFVGAFMIGLFVFTLARKYSAR